jgi:hypothetical protein
MQVILDENRIREILTEKIIDSGMVKLVRSVTIDIEKIKETGELKATINVD